MDKMGPSDNAPAPPKSARWYFFRDGIVHGPNGLEAILDLEPHGSDGKDTLVCRADFKRWYPFNELSHLLRAQSSHEKETVREIERLQEIVAKSVSELEPPKTPTLKTKPLGPKLQAEKDQGAGAAAPLSPEASFSDGALGYYFLKGRLRLGLIRNAVAVAFFHGPLTFGIAWYFWLKNSFLELNWHLSPDYSFTRERPPLFLAAIPGFHAYFIWKLATLLRTTEEQNNYRKTAPLLATILSVVPPLAIAYLQRRINLHWKMHVSHFIKNRGESRL